MGKIVMTKKEYTIEEGFAKFISFQRIKNVAEDTEKYYMGCFRYFMRFYDVTKFCNDIDQDLYYDYVRFLQSLGIKETTINNKLRGFRAMGNYWIKQGYIKHRIEFIMPKIDEPIKEVYTDSQLKALLKKPVIKKDNFVEYRTWVLTNFLLGTAVRISTAINVEISDIDFDSSEIILRKVKSRKQQVIPLSKELAKVLREYIGYRGETESDYLFCNQFGKKLCTRSAQDCIGDYNRSRGVEKTSPHLYRHTFAKLWIMNGGDIFTLQKILGHKTLDMVKKYVNIWGSDLNKKNDQFNPLDKIAENRNQGKTITMQKVKKMK